MANDESVVLIPKYSLRILNSELDCVKFLQEKGLLHAERLCSHGHQMKLVGKGRLRWSCRKSYCRGYLNIRHGTFLQNSRVSLKSLILFIYAWSMELHSIKYCSKEFNFKRNYVIDWANVLREVCANELQRTFRKIGGPGYTVEIDESVFTNRRNRGGRQLPQQWIFGGFCRETRDCFLVPLPKRDKESILIIMLERIEPGTTIISEDWKAYADLTASASYKFVDPISTGDHSKNIESTWQLAKIRHKKQYGTASHFLMSYLCEFMWRRKYEGEDLFERILQDIADYWPPE